MLFCGMIDVRWNAQLQLLVLIYLWITISHLFVCLPTLELTIFEQQMFSTKIGYANALPLGDKQLQKKETWLLSTVQRTSSKKGV